MRRQVKRSLQVKVYSELFALNGQVGFESFLRCDGELFSSSISTTTPVHVLQMHS